MLRHWLRPQQMLGHLHMVYNWHLDPLHHDKYRKHNLYMYYYLYYSIIQRDTVRT